MEFKYFLVSSQKHKEKNALSESYNFFSGFNKIESFETKFFPIAGLSLLTLHPCISMANLKENFLENQDNFLYCLKIIPLQFFQLFNLDLLDNIVTNLSKEIKNDNKWKINIKKRHNKINSADLINKIATKISSGSVDLKQPDLIIQVEIVGKFMGIGLIKNEFILKFPSNNKNIISEVPSDEINYEYS